MCESNILLKDIVTRTKINQAERLPRHPVFSLKITIKQENNQVNIEKINFES